MKPTIFEVIRRIKPLSPFQQATHLRALIAGECLRSVRRREFEAALRQIVLRQLKKENRAA